MLLESIAGWLEHALSDDVRQHVAHSLDWLSMSLSQHFVRSRSSCCCYLVRSMGRIDRPGVLKPRSTVEGGDESVKDRARGQA